MPYASEYGWARTLALALLIITTTGAHLWLMTAIILRAQATVEAKVAANTQAVSTLAERLERTDDKATFAEQKYIALAEEAARLQRRADELAREVKRPRTIQIAMLPPATPTPPQTLVPTPVWTYRRGK